MNIEKNIIIDTRWSNHNIKVCKRTDRRLTLNTHQKDTNNYSWRSHFHPVVLHGKTRFIEKTVKSK